MQIITKESAINHECVMVTNCLQLGLQDFSGYMENTESEFRSRSPGVKFMETRSLTYGKLEV